MHSLSILYTGLGLPDRFLFDNAPLPLVQKSRIVRPPVDAGPVPVEPVTACVGHRMADHGFQDIRGHRHALASGHGAPMDLLRVLEAGREDAAVHPHTAGTAGDLPDHAGAVPQDIIQSVDVRCDERCARFRGDEGLCRGEDGRHRHPDASFFQLHRGLEPFFAR